MAGLVLLSLVLVMTSGDAFHLNLPKHNTHRPFAASTRTFQGEKRTSTSSQLFALPEIKEMKLREMRAELESYGISSRGFLEMGEFRDALRKAREEGMTPINGHNHNGNHASSNNSQNSQKQYQQQQPQEPSANGYYTGSTHNNGHTAQSAYAYTNGQQTTTTTNSNNNDQYYKNGAQQQQSEQQQRNGQKRTSNTSTNSNNNKKNQRSASRQARLRHELEKAKSMRVGELRQKLKEMGINTKAFFEKTEFVRAYAEAIVDGKGTTASQQQQQQEPFDPEYRDVAVQKFDANAQQGYLLGGTIIDIDLK